jgi:hypothetical protein
MQAMSGTPLSTSWNVDSVGYYPFNRADLGRSPFLYYADAYAEYNWRLGGRYALQFSVNLSNVFNVETPTRIETNVYLDNVMPTNTLDAEGKPIFPSGQDILLSKNWNPPADAAKDGFFRLASAFFAPFQARLGIKFSF